MSAPTALMRAARTPPPAFFQTTMAPGTAVRLHRRDLAVAPVLAGFNNDWHEAGAFLIPQVEPAIRCILKKHEVDTLSDKNGIVEEKGLGDLLALSESPAILGTNLILMLRALMTDRAGCKLRHAYAHGLLSDARLVTAPTMVLWWVVLRIVLWPFRLAQLEGQDKASDVNSRRRD